MRVAEGFSRLQRRRSVGAEDVGTKSERRTLVKMPAADDDNTAAAKAQFPESVDGNLYGALDGRPAGLRQFGRSIATIWSLHASRHW